MVVVVLNYQISLRYSNLGLFHQINFALLIYVLL